MDEADKILIDTLISIGVEFTGDEVTLDSFSPDMLISATGICLEIIFESRNEAQTFPKSCPTNMASRYKVGQILSEAIKLLGYRLSIGYQSFLYPNVRDTRQIVSFLIETLPKDIGSAIEDSGNDSTRLKSTIKQSLEDNWRSPWLPYYCHIDKVATDKPLSWKCIAIDGQSDRDRLQSLSWWFDSFPSLQSQTNQIGDLLVSLHRYEQNYQMSDRIDYQRVKRQIDVLTAAESIAVPRMPPKIKKRTKFLSKETETNQKLEIDENSENALKVSEDRLRAVQIDYDESLESYREILAKLDSINSDYRSLKSRKDELRQQIDVQSKESETKAKIGILLLHGDESVAKLRAAIDSREQKIDNIECEWRQRREALQLEVERLRSERTDRHGEGRDLQQRLSLVRGDMEACKRDYQQKEAAIAVLDDRAKQQAKGNSGGGVGQTRNEFTKRILELSENRKKQNSEIRKILADIFQLQKEISSLRGKLERSFLETNEYIFASAKKDEVSKRMYKVVVGIHENCDSLVQVIEEKGRLLREIRDLEMSVESENRENVERNLEKISADYEEARRNCERLMKRSQQHRRD